MSRVFDKGPEGKPLVFLIFSATSGGKMSKRLKFFGESS